MMQKLEKLPNPWHMGTHLSILSESFPMNTKMAGFQWFSKDFASLCVALALEGLTDEELP